MSQITIDVQTAWGFADDILIIVQDPEDAKSAIYIDMSNAKAIEFAHRLVTCVEHAMELENGYNESNFQMWFLGELLDDYDRKVKNNGLELTRVS